MKTKDFAYDLPKQLIAQAPAPVRSEARLLVYHRDSGRIEDRIFSDVVEYLRPEDVLVRNTTRVIPARLRARREDTGGGLELLLLRRVEGDVWECLVKPGRRAQAGRRFVVNDELSAVIQGEAPGGGRRVLLEYAGIFEQVLERAGETPVPPYITGRDFDRARYQTVYAREAGSAAAPTAGLHFTPELLQEIKVRGTAVADILLHVGLGTFRPVSVQDVEQHVMHSEYYQVSPAAAACVNRRRAQGGRIVAVGTTSCRTLEAVADQAGLVHAACGWTDIFIRPGHQFRATDALLTNFHLPESTLLMLVSAFASREEVLRVYGHAVEQRYRFFSFGDAMLIL